PAPPSRSSKTERFSERGGHTLVPGVPPLSHARDCSGVLMCRPFRVISRRRRAVLRGARLLPLPRPATETSTTACSEGAQVPPPSVCPGVMPFGCGSYRLGAIGGCPGRRPGYDPATAGRG